MKLTPQHIAFLVSKYSHFYSSAKKLSEMLNDPVIAKEHNFLPVEVTRQAIDYQIKQEDFIKKVDIEQGKYLDDLREIKLAFRKPRLIELTDLYEKAGNLKDKQGKSLSEMVILEKRTMILREIRAEAGEDVNRLAEALEKGSTIKLSVSELILGYYDEPNDEKPTTEAQTEIH